MMNLHKYRSMPALLVLFFAAVQTAHSELFTSLADMEELLETEAFLIVSLDKYIRSQETKLEQSVRQGVQDISEKNEKLDWLRRKSTEYHREYEKASQDMSEYLSNPINTFRIIKRQTADWDELENLVKSDDDGMHFVESVHKYKSVLKFPSYEDLNGAAVAITRLQETYNLRTASVASGELNGIQYSTAMTASDCFELGLQTYLNDDYKNAELWMGVALKRLTREVNQTTDKEKVLEHLAYTMFQQGKLKTALLMTNELLRLEPNNLRAIENKQYFESAIQQKTTCVNEGMTNASQARIETHDDKKRTLNQNLYDGLCRGEAQRSVAETSNLRCRYSTSNSAFTKIAPFKLEEVHLQPYIVIFHDVLSNEEIEVVKWLAKPQLSRASVVNSYTGEPEIAHYRTSKTAFLADEEHPYIKVISQRVEDMTGLAMTYPEDLQVVNYGIGGHYEPHLDFARTEEFDIFESAGSGNRIATMLFYMSDVVQGGATVFPKIRVTLWPKKGSAAFWYNLHASGQGDFATRHAACPVLVGTKWVCNKWIHERGQEFIRPCQLQPDIPEDLEDVDELDEDY